MSSKKDKTKGGSSAGISNNPFPPLNPPAQGQAFPATGFAQFGNILHHILSLSSLFIYLLSLGQGQAQPAAPAQGMNQFSASLNMNNNSFLNNTAQQQQRGGAFMQPMQPLQATNQDVFKGNLMYHHGMNPATLKLVKEKQFQQLQDDPAVNAYEAKLKTLIKGLLIYILIPLLSHLYIHSRYIYKCLFSLLGPKPKYINVKSW